MKNNLGKLLVVGACGGTLLFFLVNARPINHYVGIVKQKSVQTLVPEKEEKNEWRRQIEEWGKKKEEAPVNARIDPVWKAIPGYNGLVVDVEASLRNMKQTGIYAPEQLVYKEVPPSVALDQLGAHPIYRGNEKKPAVSFMINVAWGNEHLDRILNTLDHYEVKTTFFLDGSWVHKYPQLARNIAERGHEIGNHAYSHPDMRKLSAERIRQEIGRTQAEIKKTVGLTPRLFAPPSGSYQDEVVSIARREFGLKTILWTADTVDWQKPPLEEMVNRVAGKLGNGVLVLMHPTDVTADGLERLLQIAKQKGLTPTTVTEVLSERRLGTP
jgi:probable sporulation protein (polysaccharide deacetylase family)